MEPAIFVVDAFCKGPHTGNPAAVCLLWRERDERWMQSIAFEMNLSETAFLVPVAARKWRLRWFTPRVEVDLCGHATLASAHVLWYEQGEPADELVFETRSGNLIAQRTREYVLLDFPADMPREVEPPAGLNEALGAVPTYVARTPQNHLFVVLENGRSVVELKPDQALLAAIDASGVIVTAALPEGGEHDFVSRFFAPRLGIAEDPVTGSAHCSLACYWQPRLGKTVMSAYQASERGGALKVECGGGRVRLAGLAKTRLEGRLRA